MESLLASTSPVGARNGGAKLQDNMEKIADMIRNDSSIRQALINITTKQDPSLGHQLTQNLRLLDNASGKATLLQADKEAIQRLTARGFEKAQVLAAYLACNKNETAAADSLVMDSKIRVDPKARNFLKRKIKAPAIGRFINENPQLKQGLNEFIAQNDPDLAQQAKENPALFDAALQNVTLGGEEDNSILSLIDREMRLVETLPLSTRTSLNTNSPSFHVMKVPVPSQNISQLRQLVVEFCIQPLGTTARQAIWWTSYVIISRMGTLTRNSGVYTEWNEFGKVLSHPPTGIIAPRTSGIRITDISKGVLNGPQTNGTILRVVDLENMDTDVDIFALLVATGMHDGAYQVHGQSTLEYRT